MLFKTAPATAHSSLEYFVITSLIAASFRFLIAVIVLSSFKKFTSCHVNFLLSLKEMSVLVGAIHNDKGAKTDKEIKELKEKIQSKQNQWQFPSSSNSTTLGQFVPKLRKEKRRPLSYWAAQMLTI